MTALSVALKNVKMTRKHPVFNTQRTRKHPVFFMFSHTNAHTNMCVLFNELPDREKYFLSYSHKSNKKSFLRTLLNRQIRSLNIIILTRCELASNSDTLL